MKEVDLRSMNFLCVVSFFAEDKIGHLLSDFKVFNDKF